MNIHHFIHQVCKRDKITPKIPCIQLNEEKLTKYKKKDNMKCVGYFVVVHLCLSDRWISKLGKKFVW